MPQGKRSTEQNRARREAHRERYNQPRPRSLLQEPTEQVRRRTLAGALLQVEPGSVSDETLAELEPLIPELIRRLREHPSREDSGRPMVEYVVRYFGIDRPLMTTDEITAEMEVARTTVINGWRGGVRWMRVWLDELAPELVQKAQADASTLQNDFTFWDRVDRNGPDGCWLWQGALDLGYGVLKREGKKRQAHRYSYELTTGSIPEGLFVAHTCRRRNCVNPEHLQLVEPGEEVK